ncbi:MAG: hypothetical protein AAB367_02405 [Patescibacteria group bacterium]
MKRCENKEVAPNQPGNQHREVGRSFEDVVAHATDKTGAVDLGRMQELEGRFGTNGGRDCDVLEGPCSCGAWH